jgi:hypothetical protein
VPTIPFKAVVDFLDADSLTGQCDAEIDFLAKISSRSSSVLPSAAYLISGIA